MQKDLIERAIELARTGEFGRSADIKPVLKREGYTHVNEHLSGLTLHRQIQAACNAAQGIPPKPPASKPKRKTNPGSKLPRSMQPRL
jgi:hypothetical protein